jgi:hypothetical protein
LGSSAIVRQLRLALIVVLGCVAGACANLVISETPWFAPDGENQISTFRNGIWLRADGGRETYSADRGLRVRADDECRFSRDRPASRWPDCAEWHVVRGRQILQYEYVANEDEAEPARYAWQSNEPMIAAGEPMIWQQGDCPVSESDLTGQPVVGRDEEIKTAYCYRALEPVASDPESMITSYHSWPVYCGPFPDDESARVTSVPWPGLRVSGEMCFTESEAALRNAARLSRPIAEERDQIERFDWLRAGYQ